MNTQAKPSDQEISIALPLRIDFMAIENYLSKEFIGTNISKTDAHGKVSNYFKILDINVDATSSASYNLEIRMKLQTLTLLFNHKDLEVSMLADLRLDIITQKLYVEAYKINSQGQNWMANNILKSILNTFIYKKIIKILNLDLRPLLKEKIDDVNKNLASKLEATPGISILGTVSDFSISHFEIKKDKIWVLVNTRGWCVIAIEDFGS